MYIMYNHSSTNNTPTVINTGENLAMTYHNSNRIKHIPTITLKQDGECIIPTKTTGTCDVESSPITCDVESFPITCDVESSPIACDVESSPITYDEESSSITIGIRSVFYNGLLQLVTLDDIFMLGDENDDLILSTSLSVTILVIKTNKYAYVP